MPASPLNMLRAGPPPPKVVLLPDGLFFSRAVPISAAATTAEVAMQVELALEANAPFPLAQLYYGFYWVPGSPQAFAYAAYRRRFTTEQTTSWVDAELVIPVSVSLFGAAVQPATTCLISADDGLTAIHWETPLVPSRVVHRSIDPESSPDERSRVRDEVLRAFGGTKAVVDISEAPVPDGRRGDDEIVFKGGDLVSSLPIAVAASLDVRDKGELEALRTARKRDLVLWRVALGCAAALIFMAVAELALMGGNMWQRTRIRTLNSRAPTAQKIQDAKDLARSIEDLVTKRRLPLEMVTAIVGTNAERKPGDITLTRIQTAPAPALNTLYIEAQTTNPAQISVYQTELQKLPEVQEARVENLQAQGDRSSFRLVVTFKPDALKPDAA